MTNPIKLNTILGAGLAAAILPASALPAHAMDAASDAENRNTIIVTGQKTGDANPNANPDSAYKVEKSTNGKFTEPLRDTPRTIMVIPKEVLQDTGATSFRDVARTTPGVTLGTGEGGNAFGDRVFIRGFEARNDVYIDNMRDPGVSSRETFAVEQIEIVKGASSAFGGRGTTGGMVSLQSKRASAHNFTTLEATTGTDNTRRATVDINRKLTNTLSLRVNGLWHDADTAGRDYVWQRRYGAAAALEWKPSDRLTLDADYYVYRMKGMSDYGLPFDPATHQPVAVNRNNFYGAVGRDFLKGGSDIGTLNAKYDLTDNLTLHSMTRYGAVTNAYVVSVPGRAPVQNATTGAWTVTTSATQRNAITRYIGTMNDATWRFATGGITHTLVAGVEYSQERVRNRRYAFPAFVEDASGATATTPTSFTLDLYNPNPVLGYTIAALPDPTTPDTVVTVNSLAGYALDTIKLGDHWEFTGGLRYDTYRIRSVGGAGTAAYDRAQSLGFLNGQAALTWKPVKAATLYGSFSTSSNPSGEQLDSTTDTYGGIGAGTQNLDPERNKAYELGAKYELAKGKLLLSAAAFRIDKDNAREQQSGNVYVTVGKLRSQGFELAANGNITSRLAVFGGYSYIDAKVIASLTPSFIGQRFANIPAHTASLLATYAVNSHLTVGGQASYRAKIYGGSTAASTGAFLPAYWRFDAVARYRITDGLEARVNVLNLTDKRYFDAIYRSGSPFSYVAPGRSATFSLTAKF